MRTCQVCGGKDEDRPHTFMQCNTNLRSLLARYRLLVIEAESIDFLDGEGQHENYLQPHEAEFIRKL